MFHARTGTCGVRRRVEFFSKCSRPAAAAEFLTKPAFIHMLVKSSVE
jgi:hypothetical protein